MTATIANVQADSSVPGVFFPSSCPYLLCFMQLHHQTTAVTGASLRRCGTTARFVMLTNTFLRSLFVVSVGTPGRLSLHRVTVHIRRGLRCSQGRFLHLILVLPQFCFHSRVLRFNTHLPLLSLPVMRRVTCSRSGRRRCAWTWVLQRSVIHDIIKC